jgi:hypothetical protein
VFASASRTLASLALSYDDDDGYDDHHGGADDGGYDESDTGFAQCWSRPVFTYTSSLVDGDDAKDCTIIAAAARRASDSIAAAGSRAVWGAAASASAATATAATSDATAASADTTDTTARWDDTTSSSDDTDGAEVPVAIVRREIRKRKSPMGNKAAEVRTLVLIGPRTHSKRKRGLAHSPLSQLVAAAAAAGTSAPAVARSGVAVVKKRRVIKKATQSSDRKVP